MIGHLIWYNSFSKGHLFVKPVCWYALALLNGNYWDTSRSMTSISSVEIRVLIVSHSFALFNQDGYIRSHWKKIFLFFLIPSVIFSELLCKLQVEKRPWLGDRQICVHIQTTLLTGCVTRRSQWISMNLSFSICKMGIKVATDTLQVSYGD